MKSISDKTFDELVEESIAIWETYDNEYRYVDEKRDRIASITNFKDNWLGIIQMFDAPNQEKLYARTENPEIKELIKIVRYPYEYDELI